MKAAQLTSLSLEEDSEPREEKADFEAQYLCKIYNQFFRPEKQSKGPLKT